MENESTDRVNPPQIPAGNPYVTPSQPPMLPAGVPSGVDANGLTEDDRTMGMLVHLLGLLTGVIGVLILWMIKKDQSKFVDFHGREALNFMITLFIVSMALMLVSVVLGIVTMGFGMFLIFPLFFVVAIGQLVCEIKACIAANKGEWHRYPMTIRMIPDAQ